MTKEKQAQLLIVNEVEKAITLLHTYLVKYTVDNQSTSVPIDYIHGCVYTMIRSFKKAANDSDKDTVLAGEEPRTGV